MSKRKFLMLIMLLLTYLAVATGVYTLWIIMEQLIDGKIDNQTTDSIIAIILTISLMINFEYYVLLRKGPRTWSMIRAFGDFNAEAWKLKK